MLFVAAIAAFMFGVACTGDADEGSRSTASPATQPGQRDLEVGPSASAAAPPRPTGTMPLAAVSADEWHVRQLPTQASLEPDHGMAFADPVTGVGEFVAVVGAAPSFGYAASSNGQFVVARRQAGDLVLDRRNGIAFALKGESRLVDVPADTGLALVRSAVDDCTYHVIRLAVDPSLVGSFELPDGEWSCGSSTAWLDADGQRALVAVAPLTSSGRGRLFLARPVSGVVDDLGPLAGAAASISHLGSEVAVISSGAARDDSPSVQIARFRPADERLTDVSVMPVAGGAIGRTHISPGGGLIAIEEILPFGGGEEIGSPLHWPSVLIADARTGDARFRILRATLATQPGSTPWLPDSSALMLSLTAGFGLADATGRLRELSFAGNSQLFVIPIPAPDDPSLVLYDGLVHSLDGDQQLPAVSPAGEWRESWDEGARYAWAASGDLLFSKYAPLGGDGGPPSISSLPISSVVQFPPFGSAIELFASGTNQELHARPDYRSDSIAPLEVGAAVVLVNIPENGVSEQCGGAPCSTAVDDDQNWWLHVKAASGEQGWLPASALSLSN